MTNPFSQFQDLFNDLGFFPRGHGSTGAGAGTLIAGSTLWAQAPMDPAEFEAAVLAARDEYEARLGVIPTVIDLPNWVRGTILEQIAFMHGFTIADRREE